jgi:ufm1-conjugating enzyme 1
MYRGGKICLDIHFAPLWAKNTPKFGIAHALAAGVCVYNKNILINFKYSWDHGWQQKFQY